MDASLFPFIPLGVYVFWCKLYHQLFQIAQIDGAIVIGIENIKYILRVNSAEYEVIGTPSKVINIVAGNCEWFVTAYDSDGNAAESEHVKISFF